MLSAIFVDRPRLAIVIAIVTTIAGAAVAVLRSRSRNIPTSCRRRCRSRPPIPAPSAAVVDATVAQPIEAQVVGVDKMIYMKSVSGDDGSYTLIASFELGTDPGHQHRQRQQPRADRAVQACRRRCSARASRSRRSRRRCSASSRSIRPSTRTTRCSSRTTSRSTCSTRSRARPASATRRCGARRTMRCGPGCSTDRLTGLSLTTGDIINAIQSQNVQAAVGRIGARPISDDQQLQLNIQTKGRLASVEEFENIVIRTNPDGSVLRLGDVARLELGAANLDRETRLNGGPAAVDRDLPGARRQRDRHPEGGPRPHRGAARSASPRIWPGRSPTTRPPSSPTTIHEVQKTLIEAFILVVIVVYLFLGSLRATLIPTLAVPVSLIGTFIVLNAIGYSANTVRCWRIVLAIGIVVDDAIVVVENVERVMEEHPELSPAEATKQAMARDHRADHRHHAGAAVGVRAGRLHPRHLRRAVPAVRRHRRGVDVPVGDQRADAVAGAVRRAAAAASRPPARPDRLRDARRSIACATPMARPSRGWCGSRSSASSWSPSPAPASSGWRKVTPTGFLPEDDQGAFFVVVQLPGGASVARTAEVVAQAEDDPQAGRGGRRLHLGHRAELHRQLLAAECGLHRRHAEAVRGAQGSLARRARASIARLGAEIPADPGRHGRAAGAAADHRPRHRRRLRLCRWRTCAAAIRRRWRRSCAA